MKKYNYRFFDYAELDDNQTLAALNDLGSSGWLVVWVNPNVESALLARELPE